MKSFIKNLPKIELHLHIEGSLEPELMFKLAKRNGITLPFETVGDVIAAYEFDNLQSFLDIYYQGAEVLQTEQDFYDLTWEYMLRCKQDNVIHTEIFFDPQTHTQRGIPFDVVINGIHRALNHARQELKITSKIIMCFLRHLSEESAFESLADANAHKDKIIGVGLDSSELGHPPEKFRRVFEEAVKQGYLTVAHAGEEGPASNIDDAIQMLKVSRVDHGVRCVEDPDLVEKLCQSRMPLTVCPLSNIKLKVFEHMEQHNIVELLRKNLCVTINSDDPAYFGGYMTDNFMAVAQAHEMQPSEVAQFSLNALEACFTDEAESAVLENQIKHYLEQAL